MIHDLKSSPFMMKRKLVTRFSPDNSTNRDETGKVTPRPMSAGYQLDRTGSSRFLPAIGKEPLPPNDARRASKASDSERSKASSRRCSKNLDPTDETGSHHGVSRKLVHARPPYFDTATKENISNTQTEPIVNQPTNSREPTPIQPYQEPKLPQNEIDGFVVSPSNQRRSSKVLSPNPLIQSEAFMINNRPTDGDRRSPSKRSPKPSETEAQNETAPLLSKTKLNKISFIKQANPNEVNTSELNRWGVYSTFRYFYLLLHRLAQISKLLQSLDSFRSMTAALIFFPQITI